RHRDLGGEVEHRADVARRDPHVGALADVAEIELDAVVEVAAQPREVPLHAGPRQVVEDADPRPGAGEVRGEVAADEPRAADHEHGGVARGSAHSASPRAASSARIVSTRSTALWVASQSASSASPSSKST